MLKFYTWLPVLSDLDKHAGRGMDGIVVNQRLIPDSATLDQFTTRCQGLKLEFWRYPVTRMLNQGTTIVSPTGLTLLDEPVMHGWSPQQWKAQATEWKGLNPGLLTLGNLEGDKFARDLSTFRPAEVDVLGGYFSVPDILLCDFYGFSRVRYDTHGLFMAWYTNKPLFQALTNMIKLAPKSTTLGVTIEAANQRLDTLSRAPTVQEFRESLWVPFLMGAKVFMIFTQSPANKKPTYETYGNMNDAMPPELELEFRLNKPRMLEVESWGPALSTVEDDKAITLTWANDTLMFDKKTYNVMTKHWSLENQSNFRNFSPAIATDQLFALQAISDLVNRNTLSVVLKENAVLKDQMKQIRTILGASS